MSLPVAVLSPLVLDACDDLASGGAGDVARRVRGRLDEGHIDMGSLLIASFDPQSERHPDQGDTRGDRTGCTVARSRACGRAGGVRSATTSVCPARQRDTPGREGGASGVATGALPACGSWPAFGERLGVSRQLRCSFCGIGWRPQVVGCTYCGEEPSHLTRLKDARHTTGWAEPCSGCGGYLKWFDVAEPTRFELLAVEDLASTPLDVLAAQQGFGRPSLPDLGGPERYPCQMEDPPPA